MRYTYSADFHVDLSEPLLPLCLTEKGCEPLFYVTYEIVDGYITVISARLNVNLKVVEIPIDDNDLYKWLLDGCILHYETTLLPTPIK